MSKDISGWKTRLTDEMIALYQSEGRWPSEFITDYLDSQENTSERRGDIEEGGKFVDFSDLANDARALAACLADAGLKRGDVVSFQLPNWIEAITINLAACLNGYICNPIIPIYRDVEVGFILADARTQVLFIPETFRNYDYVDMMERLRPDLPELKKVVVVRGNKRGNDAFEEMIAGGPRGRELAGPPDANAVKLLMYTSGTTGKPKGVLHSHNTLMAEIFETIRYWNVTDDDVILMASPVTHITGYLYGLEMSLVSGAELVLMERWDAAEAVDLIEQRGVTLSVGATPFLAEVVFEAERRKTELESVRFFGCGGAPVSPEIVRRAKAVLPNCLVARIYGSTEAPTITLGVNSWEQQELGASTDGKIVNHEVKIIDMATGAPVTKENVEGEIITRGPEVTLGYTDWAETQKAFDSEGYFHTGDIAYRSHGDYLTITGRAKDLIIRGGENLSPKDIEDALYLHPNVRFAAVVGMPHERLGETPCAFVELEGNSQLSFSDLTAFLKELHIARQKLPEKLVVLDALPRTASGKIQKHLLRDMVKDLSRDT